MRLLSLSAPPRARFGLPVAAALGALFLAGFLGGCDNPACVFGGDCSPGAQGGALGTLSASVPENGQIVRAAVPVVQRFLPTGTNVDPKSPIVLVFSEAMSSATFNSAFALEQTGFGTLPLQATALVGDGRVLVLFPITDLTLGGQYNVVYRENATVSDRTGQEVVQPANGVVGSFTVAAMAPTAPSVVLTYPDDAETGLAPTTEITVVFSHPLNPSTVSATSFVVEVGGAPPPFATTAQAVNLSGVTTDARVFRWRMVDMDGQRASLGIDREVTVELSPMAAKIEDPAGNDLPLTTFSFRTLPFSAPAAASITSSPSDAIGIGDITGAADLAVQVDFTDALAGDEIGVFVFGVQPETVEVPLTIALFRKATVVAPVTSFTFTAAELDLVRTTSPLTARVRDGTIAMAFRLKRGNLESPVRLIDVDPLTSGSQGPVLDTVAPTLTGIGSSGTSVGAFVSDARDVVLVGRASEALRGAYVSTMLGDNELVPGEIPPVVGSDEATGLFIAAPVRAGVLQDSEQPLSYALTIYDRALNAGGTANGTYSQRGAASSGVARPFSNVTVEVFDASTLAPIAGADVTTHEDVAGSIFDVDADVTDVDGRAVLAPALVGRTLVSVRRAGYDLFTFDGIPSDALSIPLTPIVQAGATVGGLVASLDPSVSVYTRRVGDTRFPRPGETLAAVNSCTFDGTDQRFECGFGPAPILARELGAMTAMAVLPPSSALLWTAPTFLRNFGLRLPLADQASGAAQTTSVVMERLDTAGIDEELLPVDVPAQVLSTSAWPTLSGEPRIRVEGLVPGLRGPLTVGQGVAFGAGLPPSTFAVRAAYPGIADPVANGGADLVGELVQNGTLEPDLFLRAEVVNAGGARGIDRPRLSATGATLSPPDPIVFGSTPIALNTTGLAYDVSFLDVLPDAQAQPGLHRLNLTDTAGRRWTVWRLDEPDAAGPAAVLHLPLTSLGEAFPLAPGDLTAVASSWSWTSFDSASFLWTDVEREFERAAHSAPATLTLP
ncbi:MAG: Ig-like domain-containing protein [Planctomycetota bacterium]|nr:Ig-like domain-containing protein [Planctomycetota bacterium]